MINKLKTALLWTPQLLILIVVGFLVKLSYHPETKFFFTVSYSHSIFFNSWQAELFSYALFIFLYAFILIIMSSFFLSIYLNKKVGVSLGQVFKQFVKISLVVFAYLLTSYFIVNAILNWLDPNGRIIYLTGCALLFLPGAYIILKRRVEIASYLKNYGLWKIYVICLISSLISAGIIILIEFLTQGALFGIIFSISLKLSDFLFR